jgi:hypothetical protein
MTSSIEEKKLPADCFQVNAGSNHSRAHRHPQLEKSFEDENDMTMRRISTCNLQPET